MNTATYEVWVRSPTSPYLRKCLIDDYKRLQFRPVVNNYAGLSIIIHQDSTHLQYIDYLDRIEVVRKILNPLTGITEQQTFGHIVLSKERNLGEDGKGSEYMTIQAMSYNVLLNSRIILPPTTPDSSGAITMTATSGDTTFATSSAITLYNGDRITPTTTTSQVRIVNATGGATSFNTTAAFTAGVAAQTFSILRAHSTYTTKKTDDLMKQYVRDCLTTATDASRILAGFSVAADTTAAPDTLAWSVRYLRLLDQLTQISDAGGVDFNVVTKTDNTLEFTTYYPQLGADRQVGNTSGNAPCVFAVERDNIKNQRWWNSALQMTDQGGNYIYVAGAGDGAGRAVVQRLSPASVTQFSRWEKFVDARDAQTDAELSDRADAKINELSKLDTGARFEALASDGNIWGVHYNLGDLVTVRIWNENATLNDQISAIDVVVDENGIETVLPIVGSEYPHLGMRWTKLRKSIDSVLSAD